MTTTQPQLLAIDATRAPVELGRCPLLRHVQPRDVEAFARSGRQLLLEPGEPLLVPGSVRREFFVLLAGRLQVHLHGESGEPAAILGPGASLGEDAMMDQRPVSGHVIAVEPCAVFAASEEAFWNLLGASHAFSLNLLQRLAERLRQTRDLVFERNALQERFERATLFDALTNLNNRRWLDTTLPRIAERTVVDARPLSIALVEIEGFEDLALRHGSDLAERLLVAAAILLRARVRPTDPIARYDRAVFAVLLPSCTLAGARSVGARLRATLGGCRPFGPLPIDFPEPRVLAGVAQYESAQSPAALLARAEAALHRIRLLGVGRGTS